ncbi:MAG: sugar phosphate isomerase/epimerase [Planctomycetota bacterium]|nr:sugar phosphate isomerase/epimerase [Planctomycetota bacterium]
MPAWRVGCSTYIWTQHMDLAEHFGRVAEEIAGAGFAGLECFSKFVESDAAVTSVKRSLAASKLDLAGLYLGGDFHDPERHAHLVPRTEGFARRLADLGRPDSVLIWGPTPIPGRAKTDAELVHEAAACAQVGAALRRLGLGPLCVHNHVPELLEDAKELDALCRAVGPEDLGLNVDLEWCAQAGFDPLAVLRRFGPRVRHLHLRNSAKKVWSEHLGEGDLEYPRIAETLREIDYRGWLILEDAWDRKRELKLGFKERAERGREAIRRWFGV